MFAPPRLAACLCLLFCFSSVLSAEGPRDVRPIVSPIIAAATDGTTVRFTSSASVYQIRAQLLTGTGDSILDSGWRDGDVLDWQVETTGQPLTSGSYRCVVLIKDLDGHVTQQEATVTMQNGRFSLEQCPGGEGLAVVVPEENSPKITLLAHDGKNGAVVSTSGDLSFRFGDFLNGKDSERMRLTSSGDLQLNGLIHAEGIVFPDGTILNSASELPGVERIGERGQRAVGVGSSAPAVPGRAVIQLPRPPVPVAGPRLTPKPAVSPDYQFKVDAAGVHIGTTSAFGLDVAGDVTLASNLSLPYTSSSSVGVIKLGGLTFAHQFGSTNTFVGASAGNFNMLGGGNTALGSNTLYQNYSGTNLLACGQNALAANTTGSSNTATGAAALDLNTDGNYNTANGAFALYLNTIGSGNTANGTRALYNNVGSSTTGNRNTANGEDTLYANSTGNSNTAIGAGALYYNSGGSGNIAIGDNAGVNLTTSDNNIDIANGGVTGEAGTIRIGSGGTHTRTFIAGINGGTIGSPNSIVYVDANGQLGTTSSSRRYKFDISDMGEETEGLMRLRPVTFRYLAQGDDAPLQYGLIAEEVAEVYPELVTRNKDGEVESVMYQFLAPMLLNEVQKQHQIIDDQTRTIEQQSRDISTLSQTLAAVEKRLDALEMRGAN